MKTIRIGSKDIGDFYPVFIIAEIGGNFVNFKQAKKLIDLAVETKVDAVKLQTFKAETISSKIAEYDMPNTGRVKQYDLFKKYEIDYDLHRQIWDYCYEKKILVFSTPSHMSDIDMLEKLNCPVYKIGSDDACNLPFLEEVAALGKPIILSTGMCTMNEVRESVSIILGKGNPNLILLHCVTNYPANIEDVNLNVIPKMKNEFELPVGYSDHTIGNTCCIGAAALGANIIEKHFTYDKNAEGPDHMLSASPNEMKELVKNIRDLEKAFGDGIKKPAEGEKLTRINNRKSIVAAMDIQKGTVITEKMICIKRPGFGIPPKYFFEIIGRTSKSDIKAETPVQWKQI